MSASEEQERTPEALFDLGEEAWQNAATSDTLPRDYSKPLNRYRESAELGHVPAMIRLAKLLVGRILPAAARNPAEGFKWLQRAAEKGETEAYYELGSCYEMGKGVEKDLAQSTA